LIGRAGKTEVGASSGRQPSVVVPEQILPSPVVERRKIYPPLRNLPQLITQPTAPEATPQAAEALTQRDDCSRQRLSGPNGDFPGEAMGLWGL
jgi:hypothetical protein